MKPAAHKAFTIVEVMLAIMIFSMIIVGMYATWSAIVQGSRAGLKAAAASQRARISIGAIQEALTTAQMFSANGKYYYFIADTSNEKFGSISFVARLPANFPGVGRYGDAIVRRVTFFTDADRNLIMTQMPVLAAYVEDTEPYRLQLAKDVTLFMFEFWDDQKKEYVSDWQKTNQLPKIVRVALGMGTDSHTKMPVDLVNRTIAMPCVAVPPQWQMAIMPGAPPGVPPGMPVPGMPPGTMPTQPGTIPVQPGIRPTGPGSFQR